MPALFCDHMVLQQGMKVPVWGWADPKEKVTVSIDGRSATARTSSDGRWKAELEPLSAGGPHTLTIKGKNEIVITDVLVGEVWICSGQSNMEMKVAHCDNGPLEVANAEHPRLRLFNIENTVSPRPLEDCTGEWQVCCPASVGDFSGAGYYFGREILNTLDIPVGMINASWGGTTAETWMSIVPLTTDQDFRFIMYRWDNIMKEKSQEVVDYFNEMGEWHESLYYQLYADVFKTRPIVPPREAPKTNPQIMWLPHVPTWLYNGMIAPLVPYAIKGVIWYQGESNAGRAYQYRRLFPALIADWRRVWEQGDFPFVFTQLTAYGSRSPRPSESAWAELREAQSMTLSVPNTAMAVTIDIGDSLDIHPKNKQDVGRRLAFGALHAAYGKDIIYSGPVYDSMTVEGGTVRIHFTKTGSGLVPRAGESPRGFAIASADGPFVKAKAMIDGDDVIVWSDDVPEPASVRYGWANNPDCNLFNREGLPVSPFRTDDRPGVTVNEK